MGDLDVVHCNDSVNSLSHVEWVTLMLMDDLDVDLCNESVNSLFPEGWVTLMLFTVMIVSTACPL